MATKADVLARLKATRNEIGTLVESTPAEAWAKSAYESWTCLTLLCHIASTSGPGGFVLMMSRLPAQPSSAGPPFDQDAFNAQEVALRADRSPAAVFDEIAANIQRDIQAIEAASDEELQKHFVTAWGTEGSVAEVIVASHNFHLGMHISDLRRALA